MSSTNEIIATVRKEVDDLQKKIDTLHAQKAEIDREIAEYRDKIKKRHDLLLVWDGKADVKPVIERKMRERSRRGFTMNSVIVEILEATGRPMSAHEILDELTRRNAAGASKSPISSVRNALQILKKRGQILNPSYGLVCLPGKENVTQPRTIRRPASQSEEA